MSTSTQNDATATSSSATGTPPAASTTVNPANATATGNGSNANASTTAAPAGGAVTSGAGAPTNGSTAPATGNGSGSAGNGTGGGFTGLGTTSSSGAKPKRKHPFSRSFMLMNVLLLAAGGGVFAVRHYLHWTGMFFDPDPNVITWAAAIALGLSVLGTGVFAWRTREFKRTLGVFFGSLCGSVLPLLLVFGVCFVTVEYRYRAAESAQQFLTQDKTEYDFAREYHAITIHEQLQANQEAAVRLADLTRRQQELSMGIAIVRNVEDTAGIGHAATDAAVTSIESAAHFDENRAAQTAKLLTPEQVTRLTAVENSACYIGHEVGTVKETHYLDCAFTEKNLLDLPVRLHHEYPLWEMVHNFVQQHASSLTAKLLP